ncbi:MAG: gfo/Idh/MocA family oxidoreductase [Acidobacteria bacterium]|nr:MAG: gfo/Idh/MocA family oxidoreductase [Acidobacteriota bacterium]REK08306.1 MAG: gfo/Idh/MocA family oxidoreductase [Acidobacteriota bacterium]
MQRLGVGFVGSGFITQFHIRSWIAVRDADVLGVWSPNQGNAERAAALARQLGVGSARAFASIEEMAADPAIDALWLCGPNHARLDNMRKICAAVASGAKLRGVACEKPLGRTLPEAREMQRLAREHGLLDGYLENQVFAPSVERGRELAWARGAAASGRPYLARAAEEHSGPHAAWFWNGRLQGGGVLNDMMCHSIEVGRYLLTEPGKPRTSIVPRRVSAQIAALKWQRPEYAEQLRERYGREIDYRQRPSEDFARATVELDDEQGRPLMIEATTSWSFVGAGLRLSMELLGPEYSMRTNSLDTDLQLFFSRELQQQAGEDLVEKQNAEMGLMPVLASEATSYGYDAENRHMVRAFLAGERPRENFDDGVAIAELLMAAYRSAEEGRVVALDEDLEEFVPAVARGDWNPSAAARP